jgi:hypothetical protein
VAGVVTEIPLPLQSADGRASLLTLLPGQFIKCGLQDLKVRRGVVNDDMRRRRRRMMMIMMMMTSHSWV